MFLRATHVGPRAASHRQNKTVSFWFGIVYDFSFWTWYNCVISVVYAGYVKDKITNQLPDGTGTYCNIFLSGSLGEMIGGSRRRDVEVFTVKC